MSDYRLDEVRDGVEEKLRWLFDEVAKLKVSNEQLRSQKIRLEGENKVLREEIAQLRRQGETARTTARGEASRVATPFYRQLPSSFTFARFFELAEAYGIGSDEAKQYLLRFIRQDLLMQKGSRIIKAEAVGRSAESVP